MTHDIGCRKNLIRCIDFFADYNQSINSPSALRYRLLKYLIPVIAISLLFNAPKFFEAQVEYESTPISVVLQNLTNEALIKGDIVEWKPRVSLNAEQNILYQY